MEKKVEEIEFGILKIFVESGYARFFDYRAFWDLHNGKLHCTYQDFFDVMGVMFAKGYIKKDGRYLRPTEKAISAYQIGINQQSDLESKQNLISQKDVLELKTLQFTNSRTYKLLTICGMLFGIIGGIFGIAAYYKKDSYSIQEDQIITKEILKKNIDSTRSEVRDDIGESQIQVLDIIYADTNIVNKK